jgi:hypothetical protein
MLLVVALELNNEFEHRLLQQSRFGAELIGRDRLLRGTRAEFRMVTSLLAVWAKPRRRWLAFH